MRSILRSISCLTFFAAATPAFAADTLIADFDGTTPEIGTRDASAEVITTDDGDKALKVTLGSDYAWPNVNFNDLWDLSAHTHLLADLTNVSDESIVVVSKVTYKGGGHQKAIGEKMALDPGDTITMRLPIGRPAPKGYEYLEELEGMDVMPTGNKAGKGIDASRVNMIQFFGLKPSRPQTFLVDNIRAVGNYTPPQALPTEEEFFPFIDKFGQYEHQDWPTKIHNDEEMRAQVETERRDLAENPAPADRDALGGWAEGPTLEATGEWRTEQVDGQWWFVTPQGRLFWSLGVTCVQPGGSTRVAPDRDTWFADAPWEDPRFASLVETKTNARGQWAGKEQKVFEYYSANMVRKFGEGWEQTFAELAHDRLPSWGFNTIGLWAKGPSIDDPPMPYVHWVYYMSQRIKVWGPNLPKWFPDVYDPAFKENIHGYAGRMLRGHADDPNLIGVFIDNELPWGGETKMGELAILAPADTPHAQAFVTYLKEQHGEAIGGLNQAWGTDYASWDAFGESKEVPTGEAVNADLLGFSEQTMRIYFETCREVVREHAPGKLYLGCRFQEVQVNPLVTRIAAEYQDVVSFNVYRDAVGAWAPPAEIDKPVIIGEWHFGAPDRGVFGSGLVGVADQQERAEAVKRYVRGAARNPLLVGAHWFQYIDEMTSGRPLDEENHQIGLVSITDTPHAETIEAFREVGAELYRLRSSGGSTAAAE